MKCSINISIDKTRGTSYFILGFLIAPKAICFPPYEDDRRGDPDDSSLDYLGPGQLDDS